jgi:hypothetical protein
MISRTIASLLLVAVSSASLLGCAATYGSGSIGASTNLAPKAVPPQGGKFWVEADADYLDRYACSDGTPLICSRSSRLQRTVDCVCR